MTKEEKKDEMKNRISMALKNPILQQGFEIICKNLADLEQENNKLLDVINNQDVKIADLEQENAELKEEQKDANEKVVHLACNQNKDLKYKLTKAKKLLEKLLITSCNSDVLNLLPNCSEVLRVRVEAEQFLTEIEK